MMQSVVTMFLSSAASGEEWPIMIPTIFVIEFDLDLFWEGKRYILVEIALLIRKGVVKSARVGGNVEELWVMVFECMIAVIMSMLRWRRVATSSCSSAGWSPWIRNARVWA